MLHKAHTKKEKKNIGSVLTSLTLSKFELSELKLLPLTANLPSTPLYPCVDWRHCKRIIAAALVCHVSLRENKTGEEDTMRLKKEG